jgi:hypothetical protein
LNASINVLGIIVTFVFEDAANQRGADVGVSKAYNINVTVLGNLLKDIRFILDL